MVFADLELVRLYFNWLIKCRDGIIIKMEGKYFRVWFNFFYLEV